MRGLLTQNGLEFPAVAARFQTDRPSRYDQRKNYEEAEAHAIGAEYVRADLLLAADAAKLRALLRNYLDQRVLAQVQTELWFAVRVPAAAQPPPIVALVVSGMNEVLNSQGYNRRPYGIGSPLRHGV